MHALKGQGERREAPCSWGFISSTIEELRESRAMHGEHRLAPPNVATALDVGSGLHVYIDTPWSDHVRAGGLRQAWREQPRGELALSAL